MSKTFNEEWDQTKKFIEEKNNIKFSDLEEYTSYIRKKYNRNPEFTSRNILNLDFSQIYTNAAYSNDSDKFIYLSEKCINRNGLIVKSAIYFRENSELVEKISKAEMLWTVIENNILPVETLWGMEFENDDDRPFDSKELEIFNYLKSIAEFYLQETEEIFEIVNKLIHEDDFCLKKRKKS